MLEHNIQSRKWLMVINHPQEHGFTHGDIADKLHLSNPAYFCLSDEIASTGTYHTHVFLYSNAPIRFGTLKKRFPIAHIEKAVGTCADNRAYIRKEGKWEHTDKAETRVEGSFMEFGTMPSEREERSPKMDRLLQMVGEGHTTKDIILSDPSFAFKARDIDILRDTITLDRYRYQNRDVQVHYLFGDSGTGKTRSIFQKHDAREICRITDYGERTGVRFDGYHGHAVLVFEEFHSQIPIAAMLNYLDIYPLMLPARYSDRVACYTTVYITSNRPLEQQYTDIQRHQLETWQAFLRRIHTVTEYRRDGSIKEVSSETYREI